jgi:hypothetical protein
MIVDLNTSQAKVSVGEVREALTVIDGWEDTVVKSKNLATYRF